MTTDYPKFIPMTKFRHPGVRLFQHLEQAVGLT